MRNSFVKRSFENTKQIFSYIKLFVLSKKLKTQTKNGTIKQ